MSEEVNQKYMKLQELMQQAEQMQQHLTVIEQQILELKTMEEGLNDLENIKEGNKVVFPFGSGIYLNAKLLDNKDIFMNVGANVIVKKDRNEAKELIIDQKKQLDKLFTEAEANFSKLSERIAELQQEVYDEIK